MFLKLVNLVLFMVCILLSVTFLTLLEQKLLSNIQIRKGPNKVGFIGLIQPFSDAMKLFSKEFMIPMNSNYLIYYISPILSLFISLFIWLVYPFIIKFIYFNLGLLFLLSCMSLGIYSMMISGWSSNSNYTLLGSLRAIAQSISYEVCMIFFMMCLFLMILSLNFNNLFYFQKYMNFFYLNYLISVIMMVIFLAETNRAPFDFAEGESELVSGFNIEYSSGGFAMIFLAEYSSILFLSSIFCFFYFGSSLFYLLIFLKISFISFMFIWVRGSYPRFRYDKLMYLTWKVYLLISLKFLIFYLSLKIFIF